MQITSSDINNAWYRLLFDLYYVGNRVTPRGRGCREIVGVTLTVGSAHKNVLINEVRNLNYQFMVAEWLFIFFGHEDVHTIAQYNSKMAQFSDNGVNFNGAYGPPVFNHWSRIVKTLRDDPDSRQAVLAIYRPPTGPTKDVPCTLTMQFFVRNGYLNTIVNMRSSDVWLGLPYDFFNFSMLANILAAELKVRLGYLTLNLGSSHLYEDDCEKAVKILTSETPWQNVGRSLVSPLFQNVPPLGLDLVLTNRIDASDFTWAREWTFYKDVLLGQRTNALSYLRELEQFNP